MGKYIYFLEFPGIDKIGLNQDFVLIDKKKDTHRRSYRRFFALRRSIRPMEIDSLRMSFF